MEGRAVKNIDHEDEVDRVIQELFSCIADGRVHSTILGALGAATTVLDYTDGDEEYDDEEALVDCCKCFIRYTHAFTGHLKDAERDPILRDGGDLAKEIFGEDRANTAASMIVEEDTEMEEEFQEEFQRPAVLN